MLWGAAAAAWIAAVTADAANVPEHVWLYLLGLALVATQTAALYTLIGARVDRSYVAMATALLSRPAADLPDGPGQVVPMPRHARSR